MPTCNSREFVSRAIDSVLGQEGPYLLELIVVDDCSSDGTPEIIRDRYGADRRLQQLFTDRNRGPGAARNQAIAAAAGEWVAPIDADDAWTHDRLSRLLPECNPDVDVLFDNLIAYDQALGVTCGTMFPDMPAHMSITEFVAEHAAGSSYNYGYLKPLIRRSFLDHTGLYYPEVRISEDLLLFLELLILGARPRVIPEPGYIYTTSVGALSRSRSALSTTVSQDSLVADLVEELAHGYRDRLDTLEFDALCLRTKRLREHAPISRLYDNWTRRRYVDVIQQLLTDARTRSQLVGKLAHRLNGRRRSPRGSGVDGKTVGGDRR